MLSQVFPFLISVISRCTSWIFTLKINDNPSMTLGEFLLTCAFIGMVIYFLIRSFGGDSFPTLRGLFAREQEANETKVKVESKKSKK